MNPYTVSKNCVVQGNLCENFLDGDKKEKTLFKRYPYVCFPYVLLWKDKHLSLETSKAIMLTEICAFHWVNTSTHSI